ncbi:MAG: undecaprenyldiphospho-muramoylpentapeptide beta-N-acetylglucosaminyltransferase, partial [Actinomycetota bacterium]
MAIAAGGTAGHLVPALALADALTARGARVFFIGTGKGLEAKLVPGCGYELEIADLRGLERRLTFKLLLLLWSLLKGSLDCLGIMRRQFPDVVVGFGGYVSAQPVLAAALMRRPRLIVELDSHMGLANRMLAPLADRVALSFALPEKKGGKYMLTGRPLSRKLLEADPVRGRGKFGLADNRPIVLMTGGSLGARTVNMAAVEAFGSGPLPFQLVHVSGQRDYEMVKDRLNRQNADLENYHLLDYTDDLPLVMAAADLIVGRSGASVQEIAALGKPALLVPYPFATARHQQRNAEWMAAAGAAEVIEDSELSGAALKERVVALLEDSDRLEVMAQSSRNLARRDGAGRIAAEVLG